MPNRRDPDAPGRGFAGDGEGGDGSYPEELSRLPWQLPAHAFLGLDERAGSLETARAVVLPVPYEATTSYGGGTRRGPPAILEASHYVELWDQELGGDPSTVGIHTLPALELTRRGPAAAMEELEDAYGRILDALEDRFLCMLGGEHAISAPAIRAQAERHGERISVLQLDAHADLRERYEGSAHSHASAMARVLDVADVVGVGIRGISEEEVRVAGDSRAVNLLYAEEIEGNDAWIDRALEALGEVVYLTFDVDYLDPSLVPSTGTPEPGGGTWYPTLRLLRRLFRERTVVGCDVVELSPIPGLHAPDFLVAKLIYKLVGYRFEEEVRGDDLEPPL